VDLKKFHVERLAATFMHKCECCGRNRDIPYRLFIHDYDTGLYLGDFDLCKECGQNMAKLIGQQLQDEFLIKEFTFEV